MGTNAKKILKISVLLLFFLFIASYAFWGSRDLIFGVKIINVNINGLPIETGAKVTNNILEIKGNAKNAINLSLNGREISIDMEGNFNETIVLLSGFNIINIKARDKFGNMDEKNYQLIY